MPDILSKERYGTTVIVPDILLEEAGSTGDTA